MEEGLKEAVKKLGKKGRLKQERRYMQHGNTSVYKHSLRVANTSLYLAKKLHLKVDRGALLRGALLHDYFLYDWHEKDDNHRLHGFHHSATALRNAKKDFHLSPLEENIIERHMFPLTPVPPRYKEAWIVCLADKYCAASETVHPMVHGIWNRFLRRTDKNGGSRHAKTDSIHHS